MMPPPIPVPNVNMIRFLYFLPAPNFASPYVAAFASLIILTGNPVPFSTISWIGNSFQHKLLEYVTTPIDVSILPGIPNPIPKILSLSY